MSKPELKFKQGRNGGAIVVDEPIGQWHAMDSQDSREFYGGYVVCESTHPDAMPLLLAAPELLAAASWALARILWHEGEGELTGALSEAISKATGKTAEQVIEEESDQYED